MARTIEYGTGPNLSRRQRLVQARPAEQVKARGRRVRHRLVPARVQELDDPRADEAGPTDDSDLHCIDLLRSPGL
ncbi:hypothetical protein GCM10023334_084710 [Nonomuraea thailandensis]